MTSEAPASELPSIVEGLNPPQLAAVLHGEGAVLILAGPGSGKTRVITHRVAHLVRDERVAPWRILAVTFTNKAAKEMRERAGRMLGEDAASLHMGTFHAMCARWLRSDGEEIGISHNFVIYDDGDQLGLMKRVLDDIHVDPRRFSPRSLLSAISSAKSELITAEAYAAGVKDYFGEVVARAYKEYDRGLHANSALDFDDLLLQSVRLFDESSEALEKYAGRYRHVLVDEFQDTNPVQYRLARQLASVTETSRSSGTRTRVSTRGVPRTFETSRTSNAISPAAPSICSNRTTGRRPRSLPRPRR